MNIKAFQKTIWVYYLKHKRNLPWRRTRDPYRILVSEVMLQQTQVPRVIPKYKSFLKKFPTVKALAKAKVSDVLRVWQGLGYNRRALYLKRAAEYVVQNFGGKFPRDFKALTMLPGIGPATAGDLLVFAWNIPAIVIETNIRSVFIHFFFPGKDKVTDKEILPFIKQTVPKENPRDWYYALFDYGSFLKQTENPSRRSAHHVRQSKFEGSHRQKRAAILRIFLHKKIQRKNIEKEIKKQTGYDIQTIRNIVSALKKEGFM